MTDLIFPIATINHIILLNSHNTPKNLLFESHLIDEIPTKPMMIAKGQKKIQFMQNFSSEKETCQNPLLSTTNAV